MKSRILMASRILKPLSIGVALLTIAPLTRAMTPQQEAVLFAALSGGGIPPTPPTSNDTQYYGLYVGVVTVTGAAPTQNTARCAPFLAFGGVAQHVDQLGMTVTTLGTGPIAVALYTDAKDATSGRHQPQTLLASGSFTVTGTGAVTAAMGTNAVGVPLAAGLNWACMNDGAAADAVRYSTVAATSNFIANLIGSSTAANITSNVANISSLTTAQTSGTWPSFVGVTFADSAGSLMPLLSARVASVP